LGKSSRRKGIKKKKNSNKPLVGQLDELQIYIGKKTNKIWVWTALDKDYSEILEWELGDRSGKTYEKLWQKVKNWQCYFWITDGYKVYPQFLPEEEQIISKTYMTRVEGENGRLRHYLARLHRQTLCYSKSKNMLFLSIELLIYYLKNKSLSLLL